jgi:hypothetical protein
MLKAHHLENNVSFGLFLIKANHEKEKKASSLPAYHKHDRCIYLL